MASRATNWHRRQSSRCAFFPLSVDFYASDVFHDGNAVVHGTIYDTSPEDVHDNPRRIRVVLSEKDARKARRQLSDHLACVERRRGDKAAGTEARVTDRERRLIRFAEHTLQTLEVYDGSPEDIARCVRAGAREQGFVE